VPWKIAAPHSRQLVEWRSPRDSPDRSAALWIWSRIPCAGFAAVKTFPGAVWQAPLVCRDEAARPEEERPDDGAWAIPTPSGRSERLQSMPFREADGRLWGRGVFDMKAVHRVLHLRVKALRISQCRFPAAWLLQLNSDEEVGRRFFAALTEKNAARSQGGAGALWRPATGPRGQVETAARAWALHHIAVAGRRSHSGSISKPGQRRAGVGAADRAHPGFTRLAPRRDREPRRDFPAARESTWCRRGARPK